MNRSQYMLRCLECGALLEDSNHGFRLNCSGKHDQSFLRSEYPDTRMVPRAEESGLFRYADWLPVRRTWPESPGPVTFRSEGLGPRIGLDNLFIVFNGYWPERGAFMETCSFKELEAISVLARVPEDEERTLVVSSAGNTGRAFLQVASRHNSPVVVVVPEFALSCMWSTAPRSPTVQLVVISGNSDYYDAIQLANAISELDPFYGEGGARNVARRDGMGTTALEAAFTIGRTPDHYFQAVGSGTGGIAAWEMTLRLLADGSFGDTKTRLHLVQNAPFTLMTDSWAASARRLATLAEDRAREQIRELHAPVLSNRFPPYSIRGGVFDALMDTDGRMYSVTNREALEAGKLFLELEGCDLDPAAEVAVAGLLNAVNGGTIPRDDTVVLNITGGGTNNVEQTGKKRYLKADIIFDSEELKNTANTPQLLALVQERMSSAREGVRS